MTRLKRLILGELLRQFFSPVHFCREPVSICAKERVSNSLLARRLHLLQLEAQTQSKSHRSTVINPFLRVTDVVTAEIGIHIDVHNLQLARRCNGNIKVTYVSKERVQRRKQRVVEDIVEVRAHLESHCLAKPEVLAHAQIHSPRSWPSKKIPLRYRGIVKQIRSEWRQTKGSRIEELITREVRVRITHDRRPIRVRGKIAYSIDKATADVSRSQKAEVAAVNASPEWSETSAALGKHVPAQIPA